MATLLPSPDVVLSEKLVLCETRLSDDIEAERSSALRQASICDVLQLAARKAVGCAVGDGVVEAEPSLVLSPDCKHLAVKEPCSRRICLLSAQDGFKEVLATLEPLPVSRDGDVVADTVLSCSWSADSKLLLVACKSSAVYLFDSTGRLLCHWDPTWSWGQLQLVAACHGPGNTILILTAARVLFLVAHNGDKQQRGSSAGAEPLSSNDGNFTQQQLQFQQQQVLEKYSVKRYHAAVSAIGYDDKSGLLVIAGDSGSISSSPSSQGSSSTGSSSGANSPVAPSAAFAEEGVTVSVWQLQVRQLNLRFALGKPQGGPGMLASTVASALGVDRPSLSAAAATRWSVVFSPLLEYVALLTGSGSVYLFSLTENCLVDPASGFAGRSAGSHTSSATSSGAPGSSATSLSPREHGGTGLKPKHIPLTPYVTDASGSLVRSSGCNRSVAWWGPRVLAVAAADGSVSLVRLPESVNILGAAPIRFAAGSRVVANYSGSRGLLIVEPISAAAAAAAAGTTAAGAAAAAVASSLQLTATEATFAADASAAVGFSAVLAARRNLAAAATASDIQRLGRASDISDGGSSADGAGSSSRASAWVARKLGVSRDELAAAAAVAGGSSGVAGWRLVLLAERTPQQMVQVHLRLRDWGSALNISKAYGLDTDAVYLARWSDAPVSRSSIQDNLPKIKSKRARVAECLTRVAPDYESARLLISYGLRETAAHAELPEKVAAAAAGHAAAAAAAGSAFVTPVKGPRPAGAAAGGAPSTPGGLTGPAGPMSPMGPGGVVEAPRLDSFPAAKAAEVRWWRLQRLKLLALNDRLETCMALKRGSYDPELFSVLRTEPLPKAAAALAAAGNVAGLAVLLQRHKSTLAPRLLQLLSALPESLDPRMYAALIPRASSNAAAAAAAGPAAAAAAAPRVTRPVGVGNLHVKGLRKVDWVESEETFQFLAAAAVGTGVLGFGDSAQTAAESASAAGTGLLHMPSIDAGPGLPIPVPGDDSNSGSRSVSVGLTSASSLDFSSWALCAEESAVMMHATEELERHCSVNGANKRTLPTDAEIASWLAARALQLDAATGQLPEALHLLELAIDKGYGQFQVEVHGSTASPGAASSTFMPVGQLLVEGRVLLQLVRSWWPVEQPQQDANHKHSAHADADTETTSAAAATAAGVDAGAAQSAGQPAGVVAGVAAAAEAALAALQPLWSVTLQQWLSVGLLAQLLAVLNGSSRNLLQQDVKERVLPLLQCYPHDQRIAALHHLLMYWIAAPATAASSSQQRGSSGSGSATGGSSSGSSSGNGIMLAAALLAGETELLQTAAAASTLLNPQQRQTGSNQQQLLAVVQAAAASAGEGSLGPLLWGGDVAAMVSAVLAAVSACRATNQWARVEQLLNAAGDALAAAAAVNGLQVGPGQLGQLGEVGEEGQALERDGRVSSSSSYGSAEDSEQADVATRRQQQQQQEGQGEEHELQQQQQQKAKQKTAAGGGGDGWGDGWSSEGEEHEQAWPSQHQQQQRDTAVLAATEPLRALVLQFALQREAVQQLQAQLDALRGQVRAARLITKHGCCVSIEQVAAADGPDAKQWLSQLLGRAERLGTSWPEAQWAQVWHDLLEARQAGLSVQLPAADLAAAFLRVLLLAQQCHLAVQFLPLRTQQQLLAGLAQGGTPNARTPTAMDGMGAFDLAMDAAAVQQHSAGSFMADHAAAAARDADRPVTAEAALAALTGGGGGMFPGRSRFGVRKALHNAAGAAVSTAVGSTAKLMGVSANLVGSTAHLVGSTAQAVQYGTGGVMGATAGLVSGTASLVSSAATFAAEAAAKAGSKAGTVFKGSSGGNVDLRGATGLLTVAEAEAVVVQVSKELLGSAASLSDPGVAAAEAVLQLLPPECKAAAAQRDSVAVLRRLPEFGVSLLPAQLTSLPDKHQLLQRILFGRHTYAAAAAAAATGSSGGWSGSSVAPWRRLGDVLELAALLGLGSEDEQNEVRLMAAEAALSAGEVGIATHLCLQLAAVRYGPAWHLAAELACPQRFAAQRKQRAAKVKQLVQQEQHVQQQLRESLQDDETPEEQQQQQPQDQAVSDSSSTAAAAAAEEAAAAAEAAEVEQAGDLHVLAGDGDASSVSIPSPATPGAPAAAAAAAGADSKQAHDGTSDSEQVHEGAVVAAEPSAAAVVSGDGEGAPAAPSVDDAKQQQEQQEQEQQQHSDAGLQPPSTPVAPASSAAEAADASATVVETAAGADARQSKGGVRALTAAELQLPARDRKKLLAFAACFCPSGELPALTDDLVFAHRELSEQQAARQKRQQQDAGEDAQQHEQQQVQELSLLLPLQQASSRAFQQQRQQLLRMALAAAATALSPKGWVDPYKGLFSFGDPQALLAVLLSCSSPSKAQQLLDDVLSTQLSASANGSSASAAGGSYCSLQRLLVVGAAAQLLLVMQHLPEGVLVEVVAGAPGSKASCSRLKLPHHQELLLQLLHVPMGRLQLAAKRLLQQQEQQRQVGLLPGEADDAVAAAGALMSRLQQVADGRQLLQWLPGIETGRFFAGDKQYQEQVLIELASKAGQMAVQPLNQQMQEQQDQQQQAAAAQALMSQAQQLAASYGADPYQLELWFVHSLVLYAPDINQPDAQSLLAAHAQQLVRNPAAAAAHLYYNTYPLLPAAAAGQCACVLDLIHSALQAFCTQQQQQGGSETAGSGGGGGSGSSGGGSGGQAAPTAVTVALPQLEKLKELLVKSSKALTGLAAKALIGGHVALMVGPAVAAAAALAADQTAAAAAMGEHDATKEGSSSDTQQHEDRTKQLQAAAAAAASAVASVDLPMVLLEASSAVSAFVSTPGQAGVVAKFIRHMNTLAEMHARASVGDKPKQQVLQKLAQGVSPGLPHLLLFMRSMTNGTAPEQQQQQYWADPDDQAEGLNRVGSGESFQSAISVSSSQASGQHAAHPGHNPAAAMAIEWATARARYASSSGRQQLLNCSALQLSAVATWLVLSQQQPVSPDAIGQLQPLAMGPGLQLQLLTDVITLVANPEAQLPGMVTGAKRVSSGGSSRGSSFQQSSVTAEQAAATAVAAAAALSAATGVPVGGLTPLMRDDPAAIAAWQPPSLSPSLIPKRRELVVPLLQAAARIVAKHIILSAVAAAAPAGAAAGAAAEAAIEDVASVVSQAAVPALENGGQQGVAQASCMLELLQGLVSAGSFSAVAALQLAHQLASLKLDLGEAVGQQQQPAAAVAADGADSSGDSSSSVAVLAGHQAEQAVSNVLQQLTQAALQQLQQQLTAEEGDGSMGSPAGASSSPKRQPSALQTLQLLVRSLEQDAAPASSPKAAAVAANEADDADSAAATDSSSWVASSLQQLRSQVWDALQQHQAQLPAEAYSSTSIAELLELQETVSSGAAWPGWATSAGAGAAAAGAAAAGTGDAGGRPKSSGAGLLLARTMTALSKQFPGLKASADDLSSIEAAAGLFSSLVTSSSPLSPSQCAALTHLLTDIWREGAALPQPQATAAGAETADGDADAASTPTVTDGELQQPEQEQEQQQDQEQLAASVGLPVGSFQLSQLHSCWYQLLLAMLQAGYVQDLLALLDQVAAAARAAAAAAAASGDAGTKQQQLQSKVVLLPLQESEAQQLMAAAEGPLGPAGQAVLGLLLPYRSCQQGVIDQLLQGNLLVRSREPWAGQLLLLLLLRGRLSDLAAAAAADSGGSGAQVAGSVARGRDGSEAAGSVVQQQLYHLYSLLLQPVLAAPVESSGLAWAYLTCLFPHAVSQLCQMSDYAAAAALVAAKMRTCSRLCSFGGAVLVLQRYLKITMQHPWQPPSQQAGTASPLWLPCCEAWLASAGADVATTAHTRLVSATRSSAGGA